MTTDPRPDPTKDAVLALADDLVSVMTIEIYAAMLDEPSMKNKFSDRVHLRQQRARQTVDALLPLITARIAQARVEEMERAAQKCEEQATIFASEEYATGQPLSSLQERFACAQCAVAIRARKETTNV